MLGNNGLGLIKKYNFLVDHGHGVSLFEFLTSCCQNVANGCTQTFFFENKEIFYLYSSAGSNPRMAVGGK